MAYREVRKAVEARRSERVQKRRLQPVTDPEAKRCSWVFRMFRVF